MFSERTSQKYFLALKRIAMLSEISNSVGNIVRRKEENHERRVKRVDCAPYRGMMHPKLRNFQKESNEVWSSQMKPDHVYCSLNHDRRD